MMSMKGRFVEVENVGGEHRWLSNGGAEMIDGGRVGKEGEEVVPRALATKLAKVEPGFITKELTGAPVEQNEPPLSQTNYRSDKFNASVSPL